MSNSDKIQFIICTNDKRELEECKFYIKRLRIPKGMQIEITVIEHAVSMASGYNWGMRQSDAKYRIYMHQDTCLIYQDMLRDLISVFEQNLSVGMLGMVGIKQIPKADIVHNKWNIGRVDVNYNPLEINHQSDEAAWKFTDVEAIDGLFMATQYDISWREDLFKKWDFYDISQSLEMKRHGYQIAVPYQSQSWCWHDNEVSKWADYEGERRIFSVEYQDIRAFEQGEIYRYNAEQEQILTEFQKEIFRMIDSGKMAQAEQLLQQYHALLGSVPDLICLENICYVRQVEKRFGKQSLYGDGMNAVELLQNFREDKFLIKRIEYSSIDDEGQLLDRYGSGRWSRATALGLALCYAKDRDKVMSYLDNRFGDCGANIPG